MKRKNFNRFSSFLISLIVIFTTFGHPLEAQASLERREGFPANDGGVPTRRSIILSEDLVEGTGDAEGSYTVEQNEDPLLEQIGMGEEGGSNRYGPKHTGLGVELPRHAYTPGVGEEQREGCPSGGCDYVAGRVLIKFASETALSVNTQGEVMLQEQALMQAIEASGIMKLSRIFPAARVPKLGVMIENVEGELVAEPDLTLWYQAEVDSKSSIADVIEGLRNTRGIEVIEPDFIRRPIGEAEGEASKRETMAESSPMELPGLETDPLYSQQWHLEAANVALAWAELEAEGLPAGGSRGITVAVIDTGVDYLHEDLAANMWVNAAEFNGMAGVDDDQNGYVDDIHGADTVHPDGDPRDDHGHGTHVAGIIAAQAGNGMGGVGVAYNTQIMAVKAAQYSGVLASSDIAEGIYYAVSKGADVINMSFGGYARSTLEEDALAVAFSQAVLVAAAGNDGIVNYNAGACPIGMNTYPAAYNWVLGVMSRDQNPNEEGEYLSSYSNYDCVDWDVNEYELMAPGENIISTLPGGQYAAWSGTSMAAPVVAGIAALTRTKWADKQVYSSRFIMGQMAATGPEVLGRGSREYAVPDALAALTTAPMPRLSYMQHWLFDTEGVDPVNDNDGIVDAGEIIDLGVVIRNHWGQTTGVTVQLEAIAEGAFGPDPYVTMLEDTISYEPIGSFNWQDNGLVYSGDVVIGVEQPFKFTTDPDTPNDHVIPFRLTMTTRNGLDPEDAQVYTYVSRFNVMVQRGRELPYVITEDMTLTKAHYWLVPNATLIAEGVTLTVTEGTQIQFFSIPPSDPYSQEVKPFIQVEGSLIIAGTAVEPVELFTGLEWQGYPVHIFQVEGGYTSISYARISNPVLGSYQNLYNENVIGKPLDLVDHAYFWQTGSCIYKYYKETNGWSPCRQPANVISQEISYSIFYHLGFDGWPSGKLTLSNPANFESQLDSCLFDNSGVDLKNPSLGSVFIGYSRYGDTTTVGKTGYRIHEPSFLRAAFPRQYSDKTYVLISPPFFDWGYSWEYFQAAERLAEMFGGYPVAVNSLEEAEFLDQYRYQVVTWESFQLEYSDMDCGTYSSSVSSCWQLFSNSVTLGLTSHNEQCEYRWISGEPLTYTNWAPGEPSDNPCLEQFVISQQIYNGWATSEHWGAAPIVLELPGVVDDAALAAARERIIEEDGGLMADFRDNAILNDWWNPDKSHWLQFEMDASRENARYIHNNYWGTTDRELIDESIFDFYDDFNLGEYRYEPILTEAPETAYPFVSDIVISTAVQAETVEVGAEEVTFTVHFNRDMDMGEQPLVTFGPAYPYTDYVIEGDWATLRTWVGRFVVTPVTGNGYQMLNVVGAVAADDPWLVTGRDAGRYRFKIVVSGSAAMNLQASTGNGFVDLMWTQSDFELLAGFNLYRSTQLNGEYTRLNSAIIGPDVRGYRDGEVIPGQPYFYKFRVVKTDMTESDYSNTASGTPLDTIAPELVHMPVSAAQAGLPLTLTAEVTDNVGVEEVKLFYRHVGEVEYMKSVMLNTTGIAYYATIPGSYMVSPGIDYYLEATDGSNVSRNGRAEAPNVVVVEDRPVVTGVTPGIGSVAGGETVTISGSNFKVGAAVTFGGASAGNVSVNSSNQISCMTPAHFPAAVDVRVENPGGQFGVLLNGYTYQSTTAVVSLPNTGGGTGSVVTVPVNAANIEGLLAATLEVNYNAAILRVSSVELGSLTGNFGMAANVGTPGMVRISLSSSSMVSGAGTLALINFEVLGGPGSTSELTLSNTLFNDGAITAELGAGSFVVDEVYSVSGEVDYWANSQAVSGVLLTLSGERAYTAQSGEDGAFAVQAPVGSYILKASKTDEASGITAYDASLVLQADAGLIYLTDYGKVAGDVNGNGLVNAMDASYILQRSVGLIEVPFPGAGVVWKFRPEQREIPDLIGHVSGQFFNAILLGDVSGNWMDAGLLTGMIQDGSDVILSIPEKNIYANTTELIPIKINLSGKKVFGINLILTYDPQHLYIHDVSLSETTADWIISTNYNLSGIVRIAMAGATPILSSGDLIHFSVTAIGLPGTSSTITITQASLNEGAIPADIQSGIMKIGYHNLFIPLLAN